ncbi:hypothetical protein BDQ17DRAFT_1331387 [Cyathus striatus]|nr:hypothetical protein BDQ17DRAFT_1331387 [Cyathus striatus]
MCFKICKKAINCLFGLFTAGIWVELECNEDKAGTRGIHLGNSVHRSSVLCLGSNHAPNFYNFKSASFDAIHVLQPHSTAEPGVNAGNVGNAAHILSDGTPEHPITNLRDINDEVGVPHFLNVVEFRVVPDDRLTANDTREESVPRNARIRPMVIANIGFLTTVIALMGSLQDLVMKNNPVAVNIMICISVATGISVSFSISWNWGRVNLETLYESENRTNA